MQREIGTQVNIGENVSTFESVVPFIDKNASNLTKLILK